LKIPGLWSSLNAESEEIEVDPTVEKFLATKHPQFEDTQDVDSDHVLEDNDKNEERQPKFDKDLKGKDWLCPSCQNTNWSWRTNCNMCATPKPFVGSGKVNEV
jgi:hypothetical protein